jgi:hypothetical protein
MGLDSPHKKKGGTQMSATREDHTKLGNLMLSMAHQTGHIPSAEDAQKLHGILDAFAYGKAIEYLLDIVSDSSQPQSEKDAAVEIAANLNWMYNEQVMLPGETCFYCGYEHSGAPGYACNGGQGWDS